MRRVGIVAFVFLCGRRFHSAVKAALGSAVGELRARSASAVKITVMCGVVKVSVSARGMVRSGHRGQLRRVLTHLLTHHVLMASPVVPPHARGHGVAVHADGSAHHAERRGRRDGVLPDAVLRARPVTLGQIAPHRGWVSAHGGIRVAVRGARCVGIVRAHRPVGAADVAAPATAAPARGARPSVVRRRHAHDATSGLNRLV